MKSRVNGLRLAPEQDYQFDNSIYQRASNQSIHSSVAEQSQRDLSLSTISEIPKRHNLSLASERIKHAYRKEKVGNSLTHRENKKSLDYNQSVIMSARNTPQYKNYPHQELYQHNQIPQNYQLSKYLNQHDILYSSRTIEHKSPLVSQRDKMKQKQQKKREISEERLRSLSSHSLDQKCCKPNINSQKNIDKIRSCSQCSTHFQMSKYELEEERQKIQYILSVSGSIQNYEMYSNQEINAENRIISQYVRRFKRYVDFVVQTNELQIEQELEDIDAKLQTQKEHIEFYSKQESKYKLLYNKLQNPFYANNLSVKAEEIKRNNALLKKEIHNLLSGRGINKSPRDLTVIQKATNLQKEVNLYAAILKERRKKLEDLIEVENNFQSKQNPQIKQNSSLLNSSQNNSDSNQTKIIHNIQELKSDQENKQILINSQDNLKDTKWNKSTNVTLETDIESYQNRKDTLIRSQKSNLSPNPNYISFSQETQPSQLHLESITDDNEHIPIIDKEIPTSQNSSIKKQLQKITIQSPYLSHKSNSKQRNDQIIKINRATPDSSRQVKLTPIEKTYQQKNTKQNNFIHYQNYLNRRNSMISERNNSQQKSIKNDETIPQKETSLEKENKIKSNFSDIDVNLLNLQTSNKRYQFKNIGYSNKNQPKQQKLSQSPVSQVHLKQQHQQLKLNEQLSQLKNQLAQQRIDQVKKIQEELIEISNLKNQYKIQEEKCKQLDEVLEKQDSLITELS